MSTLHTKSILRVTFILRAIALIFVGFSVDHRASPAVVSPCSLARKLFIFVTGEFLFPEQAINDRDKKTVSSQSPRASRRSQRAQAVRFCSPPSPNRVTLATIPMIIANAVIITGRQAGENRLQAGIKRVFISCAQRSSLAKVTTKMLLAVATPMAMIAPMSEGTLTVASGQKKHPDDAAQRAAGSDNDKTDRSKIENSPPSRVNEHRWKDETSASPANELFMLWTCRGC